MRGSMQHKASFIAGTLKRILGSQRALYASKSPAPSTAGDFWSSIAVRDLPDSTAELEIARRHNTSLQYRPEQVIQGCIVQVDRDHVTIDTGHHVRTAFAKKELNLSQLVRSRDSSTRQHDRDFRVGDILNFMLEELVTPFGDIGLRVFRPNDKDRLRLVYEELHEHYKAKTPVMGRILNSTSNGHIVGIAGVCAWAPQYNVSHKNAERLGMLQEFFIKDMHWETKELFLCDRRNWEHMNRPRGSPRLQSKFRTKTPRNQTLERPQILSLIASARLVGGSSGGSTEPLPALQEAARLAEHKGHLTVDQVTQMLLNLQADASPEVFKAICGRMASWGYNLRRFGMNFRPGTGPQRIIELKDAKPAQTHFWQTLVKKGLENSRSKSQPVADTPSRATTKPESLGRTEEDQFWRRNSPKGSSKEVPQQSQSNKRQDGTSEKS